MQASSCRLKSNADCLRQPLNPNVSGCLLWVDTRHSSRTEWDCLGSHPSLLLTFEAVFPDHFLILPAAQALCDLHWGRTVDTSIANGLVAIRSLQNNPFPPSP